PEGVIAPNIPKPHTELQPAASHRVTGTVKAVDQKNGLLALSASEGTLKLHFPPRSLHNLKKGDTITAQIAFAKTGTEGSTRAYDVPNGLGEHRMTGTVSKLDREKGFVRVKTHESTLDLYFPPQMVRNLKQGDRITVDLAFSHAT